MKKLNLGCGIQIFDGFINLDLVKMDHIDIVHDIRKFPWPIKNNEFDLIYSRWVLEHVSDFTQTIEEIGRILKINGILELLLPYQMSWKWVGDPSHKIIFSHRSFNNYLLENPFAKAYATNYDSKIRFEIVERKIIFSRNKYLKWLGYIIDPIINLCPIIYERFFFFYLPAEEIYFKLKLIKK